LEDVVIQHITVDHVTFVTDRPFDAVVQAFEAQVGSLEQTGWSAIPASSGDKADFERRVRETLGPSGFTRFLTIDHGEWVTMEGRPTRFIQYTAGNPFIAFTMIQHDIEAGLDVPVRLAIYEHPDGRTRLVFNTPSSLMSGLHNEAVHAAALKLDAKMTELGEAVTGVKA
jgi:uncharacterized protein (DUF302 family)